MNENFRPVLVSTGMGRPGLRPPFGLALLAAVLLLLVPAGTGSNPLAAEEARTQVVVTLASPPLAHATGGREAAAARIEREHAAFERALASAVPDAAVRWRYRLVANGMAVVIPSTAVGAVSRLPGVKEIFAGVRYGPQLDRSVRQIGAEKLWEAAIESRGDGIKIGIIDDGVDQRHAFFSPGGYTMPAGYPKGQRRFTTAKVIVARAFPPATPKWKNASKPFDPELSSHGTHVAGIAAGNEGSRTDGTTPRTISGVAPRAYIGNYKALTIPTDADVGLDGNSPELVAAIEAAVADGMDVINLSIGEPEIEPTRDLVALALDAAAAAGVVPVVAAGNDFGEFGPGSVTSPGSAAGAITVSAVTTGGAGDGGMLAGFSSAGPTPLSLRLKPDVAAPGVSILSSEPGGWGTLSGTSMAAPHVAGAAALLRERHPEWTVAQLKSALSGTADPVRLGGSAKNEASPTRAGGGLVNLSRADRPLVFTAPVSVSFGLVGRDSGTSRQVTLSDAGGGAGTWNVAVVSSASRSGVGVTAPKQITVPGELTLTATAGPSAAEGEVAGQVVLSRGGERRRVPFWLRLTVPALSGHSAKPLAKPGVYGGNTKGRPSLVDTYRYPDLPAAGIVAGALKGPEQVFRLTLKRPVANFGVVVIERARGVGVEPRIVSAGDENRLTGYAGLPLNLNPYLVDFGDRVAVAGAVRPKAGSFDIVFDSPGASGAGAFRFRLWINDTKPPTARLRTRTVKEGSPLVVGVTDGGAGIDPGSITVKIDGQERNAQFEAGKIRIPSSGLGPGRHRLRVQVSDYQETRNTENVAAILPNTRVLTTSVTITGT